MAELTSRERMLRAIDCLPVDHLPCCFMSFGALRKRLNEDVFALTAAELALGLDSMLFIPGAGRPARPEHPDLRGLPVRPHPDVRTVERREQDADGVVLHKEVVTPAGSLTTSVRVSDDWVHGDHIPFIDDYQIPRTLKPLITGPGDLDALQYLLTPPGDADVLGFRQEAARAQAFAAEKGCLLAGGWGVGLDMLDWLCGMQELMLLTADQPAFVTDLLELVHRWNMGRMALVLSGPVDLYIRRGWYEGVDFILPGFFRAAVLPRLKAEADLAHERGARFGYICTSGSGPLLDAYLEAGVDVLIGVDPLQGTHTDLPAIRRALAGKAAVWGGVSGALTVEQGSEEDVRAAVQAAIAQLGPDGFLLSPVDNLTLDTPLTWRNVDILIDEWRRHW
jgi:hypothetical protein